MDLERLKRLGGINESFTLKPVNVTTDTSKSVKAAEKQAKINNSTPKNKSAKDVRTVDDKSDIKQNIDDKNVVDQDNEITDMKSGKKDINGQRTITKHEKLNYTISIDPKTGCPKVDDELKKEMIDVESWGEKPNFKEAYVVASTDNVYICIEHDCDEFVMLDDRNKAVVFETIEQAQQIADLFDNSTIRLLTIQEKKQEDDKKEQETMCKTCKCCPCECDEEDEEETDEDEKEEEESCGMKESSLSTLPSLSQYVISLKESKKEKEKVVINNLVAKHASKFNKSAVHRDRKKDQKRGATKHKTQMEKD